MLIQAQKKNLNKMLDRYSFEHLRPSPEVYEIQIPQSDLWMPTSSNDKRRKIYYKVKYEVKETQAIDKVRQQMIRQNFDHKVTDQLILKHVYMGKWDVEKTMDRLNRVMDYHHHPQITDFGDHTVQKLEGGMIYTYGQDRGMRPIMIIRVDRFDFDLPVEENFNAIYFLFLVVLGYRMVPYHAQKFTLVMDFNHIALTDIPFSHIYDILERLNCYYCGGSQRILLYNSKGISNIWRVVSWFLPENVKRKVVFIDQGKEHKVLDYIDPFQLQKRYGGKLPNLDEYWPPKNPGDDQYNFKLGQAEENSDQFLSVENNESFFRAQEGTCSPNCQCTIY